MENKSKEQKDRDLFNTIGRKYAQKDLYPPSSIARKFQVQFLLDTIQNFYGIQNFNKLLEVGCGSGANAEYAKNYFQEYLGLDYSEELIQIGRNIYGKEGVEFITQNLKSFDTISNYDLIIGVGVLHHITDLSDTLKLLRKKSKKNTVMGFIEPQRSNPLIQLLRIIRKLVDKNYSEEQVFFSKNELRLVFENAGYSVDKIGYIGYFSVPFAQVIIKPCWLFLPISKFCIGLDRFIQNHFNNRIAWNMFLIART